MRMRLPPLRRLLAPGIFRARKQAGEGREKMPTIDEESDGASRAGLDAKIVQAELQARYLEAQIRVLEARKKLAELRRSLKSTA
jgi:hypothetical protein